MSVRVYQLAKQLGLDNKRVIKLLRERGLDVNGPSNTIPNIYANALIEEIGDRKLVFSEEVKDTILPTKDEPMASVDHDMAPPNEREVEITISNSIGDAAEKSSLLTGESETKLSIPKPIDIQKQRDKLPDKDRGEKPKRAIMVSVSSLDKTKRKDDTPEVRLPELLKNEPVPSDEPPANKIPEEPLPKFKPFFKKIERQLPKSTNLQTIEIKAPIVVRTLATQMNVKPFQLISKLMSMNIFASMNQEIDFAVAQSVAEKFGYLLAIVKPEAEKEVKIKQISKRITPSVEKAGQNFVERPPIVCVLGHVDHGKTTLLDTIRHAHVAGGEAGGITQHVAAYQIEHKGKKITFIDTPGHAAFSKMRERGANITDIGILLVAADDGFMPQTDEALKFAKNANIPIVVAINKIDAKGANLDRVRQQMQQRGIASEDWGGETLCAEISALHGTNIDHLLELILLQAEIMELRSDATGHPEGVILESKITVGHGATANAIIQNGILKIGDCITCGSCYCKVKSLVNDRGEQVKEAHGATPIGIIGWSNIPEVGGKLAFVGSEKLARKQIEEISETLKQTNGQGKGLEKISSVDQLLSAIAAVEEKVLNIIVRADVHGSVEALCDFLGTIKSKKIKLNILDSAVGTINKNDILFADTAKAQIVAFNVKVESSAQSLAKQLGVKIIHHNVIYELVEQVREAMADCLDPELHESKLGAAEIRQIFNIKNSIIAGCMVTEGRILRDKFVRIIRKKETIFQGKFASVKRQKEDAGEVRAGFECGIIVSGFDTFETGDIAECFEIKKTQPSL
ncbi:MAG: translation initiation factor IF-2 [Puniceicoccales bacterium]|jgi:translation initiation factor IF-2|nr:translation initiation factor IF-2 [Puniceicoccales bacterium]